MDQEPQPTVWPPAPQGMEPTPSTSLSKFKPAPVVWVIGLTAFHAVTTFAKGLCALFLALTPMHGSLLSVFTGLTTVQIYCNLSAYVALLVWFYRVYKNLYAFETAGLRYTAGWVVAWFFIPIFSLVRPYQMAQTIWKASTPNVNSADFTAWQQIGNGRIVKVWWGVFLLSGFLGLPTVIEVYQTRLLHHPFNASRFYLETALSAAGHAVTALMTIIFIRAVSARQQEKEVARFWSA